MTTDPAPVEDVWAPLRPHRRRRARPGRGLAADCRVLEFQAAHAAARDAVHEPLDAAAFAVAVGALGMRWSRWPAPPGGNRGVNTCGGQIWVAPLPT